MKKYNSECLSWDNRNVGTKDIPTDIPERQTPVRGVVTRKSKVIFDEVFFVNTEDLEGDSNDGYLTLEPKESLYRIVGDTFKKDKDNDYRWWGHCMWEYSIFNINENKWERFRMLF